MCFVGIKCRIQQQTIFEKTVKDLKMRQVVCFYSFNPHYFKIFKITPFFFPWGLKLFSEI